MQEEILFPRAARVDPLQVIWSFLDALESSSGDGGSGSSGVESIYRAPETFRGDERRG